MPVTTGTIIDFYVKILASNPSKFCPGGWLYGTKHLSWSSKEATLRLSMLETFYLLTYRNVHHLLKTNVMDAWSLWRHKDCFSFKPTHVWRRLSYEMPVYPDCWFKLNFVVLNDWKMKFSSTSIMLCPHKINGT